jgi:hypothetical protein
VASPHLVYSKDGGVEERSQASALEFIVSFFNYLSCSRLTVHKEFFLYFLSASRILIRYGEQYTHTPLNIDRTCSTFSPPFRCADEHTTGRRCRRRRSPKCSRWEFSPVSLVLLSFESCFYRLYALERCLITPICIQNTAPPPAALEVAVPIFATLQAVPSRKH